MFSNDPFQIMRSMDADALGVIVPLVNNAEEAACTVAACHYLPRGIRSYVPIRAAGVIGSKDPEDLAREILCIVMVEMLEGLEKVEEIAATPGVDGIYIGPADLALSLGLPPTTKIVENAYVESVRKIRETYKKHGIVAGIHATSGEWARKHAEAGFDMVTVAADASLLEDAARREVAVARGE